MDQWGVEEWDILCWSAVAPRGPICSMKRRTDGTAGARKGRYEAVGPLRVVPSINARKKLAAWHADWWAGPLPVRNSYTSSDFSTEGVKQLQRTLNIAKEKRDQVTSALTVCGVSIRSMEEELVKAGMTTRNALQKVKRSEREGIGGRPSRKCWSEQQRLVCWDGMINVGTRKVLQAAL